jgi:hypothetical protein
MLVDNIAPSGSITSPTSGQVLTGTVTVTSNSADTGGSNLASVTFQYQPTGQTAWTTIGTPSTATSASWNTTNLTDGTYLLQVATADTAGNTTTSPPVSVTVDNRTVSVSLVNSGTAGTANRDDQIRLQWSAATSPATFCAGWSGSTLSASNIVVTISDNATNNDKLTVAVPSCAGGFLFGTLYLGANYTTSSVSFSGSGANQSQVQWNAATNTMTIILGSGNAQATTQSTGLSYAPAVAPFGPFAAPAQRF